MGLVSYESFYLKTIFSPRSSGRERSAFFRTKLISGLCHMRESEYHKSITTDFSTASAAHLGCGLMSLHAERWQVVPEKCPIPESVQG